MKCTYTVAAPRLLLEAQPGELFTLLGPELVECVCAVRSRACATGFQNDVSHDTRLDPDALVPVVVLACRVGADEPEYYPPGYEALLPAASPVAFLEQVEPLALRARSRVKLATGREVMLGEINGANLVDNTRPELASRL
jgi:hypothetical protein